TLPLAAIALGAFLVLVVVAVVLLVSSLSTPLRIPGFRTTNRDTKVDHAGGVEASQIYFTSIARVSLAEWRTKWSSPAPELENERLPMYVEETHNLAIRTNFKYERTTEAIATFSLALFAFGLAVILVFSAATTGGNAAVTPDLTLRLLLAAYVAVFSFIEL